VWKLLGAKAIHRRGGRRRGGVSLKKKVNFRNEWVGEAEKGGQLKLRKRTLFGFGGGTNPGTKKRG